MQQKKLEIDREKVPKCEIPSYFFFQGMSLSNSAFLEGKRHT